MRRAVTGAILAVLACAAPASAAPVLVLEDGRAEPRKQRFAGRTELPQPPRARRSHARPRVRASGRRPVRGRPTRRALARLLRHGQIDQPTHDLRRATLEEALRAQRGLDGRRRLELRGVIANTDAMARDRELTPSRLAPVFETLERNRQWWTAGPLLASGERVGFDGSRLVWQYYPGEGIQLQMLANFGKANSLWNRRRNGRLRQLVGELVPLASDRDGVLAWEYFFDFGGGSPPWTSGMSQGTGLQALARASRRLSDPALLDVATRGLELFERRPPDGVRKGTRRGNFYLLYTFAPDLLVLNGHLQAVIGLFDFAQISGDPRAERLYASGEAKADAVLPRYDTGAWSLYSREREADLGYHTLIIGFLENLCERSGEPEYCDRAARWQAYTETPPEVSARTRRIRAGRPARLRFTLDKISRVGVTVSDPDGDAVFATSAVVGRGTRHFTWSRPARSGRYTLTVTATDLAGNAAEPAERALRILRRRR